MLGNRSGGRMMIGRRLCSRTAEWKRKLHASNNVLLIHQMRLSSVLQTVQSSQGSLQATGSSQPFHPPPEPPGNQPADKEPAFPEQEIRTLPEEEVEPETTAVQRRTRPTNLRNRHLSSLPGNAKQRKFIQGLNSQHSPGSGQQKSDDGEGLYGSFIELPGQSPKIKALIASTQARMASEKHSQALRNAIQTAPQKIKLDWSGNPATSTERTNTGPDVWLEMPSGDDTYQCTITFRGNVISVCPQWLVVHQEETEGEARMYISSRGAITDDKLDEWSDTLEFLIEKPGLTFVEHGDVKCKNWFSFKVGYQGMIGAEEVNTFWPNQVIHPTSDRVLKNVRSVEDILDFLADPVKENMEQHKMNLDWIQQEEGYDTKWVFYSLQSRWGKKAMSDWGFA